MLLYISHVAGGFVLGFQIGEEGTTLGEDFDLGEDVVNREEDIVFAVL